MNREIQQKTLAAWKKARSFNEIRALSQFYMEQSQAGNYCVTPYNFGPMTDDQCQHINTLIRLQSYGVIPLDGVNPTGIRWEQLDGEYVHTRTLSAFSFLIRHGNETSRFLDKIKNDNQLNKRISDCLSGTNMCTTMDGPTTIQRRARDMKQLYKEPFTVIEGVSGVTKLDDCGLEEIDAITSAGVYVCLVLHTHP